MQGPTVCTWCGAREVRRDPIEGEERCGACGRPAPLEPPPVLGGQGRDAAEVVDDGDGIVRLLIVAGFLVAAVAVGAWAAGGGR